MAKKQLDPGTYLAPLPAVLVTCADQQGNANIITIAWTGVLASNPVTVGIGVRPSRHSYKLLHENGEYVINLPGRELLEAVDYCGTMSGKEVDKFEEADLTPLPPTVLEHVPLIKECPVNLECKVKQVLELGSHDYFVAEVVAVHVDEEWMNGSRYSPEGSELINYINRKYYGVGEELGPQGFSVRQK